MSMDEDAGLEAGRFGLIVKVKSGRVNGWNYCASCDRATPRDFCPKCGQAELEFAANFLTPT